MSLNSGSLEEITISGEKSGPFLDKFLTLSRWVLMNWGFEIRDLNDLETHLNLIRDLAGNRDRISMMSS